MVDSIAFGLINRVVVNNLEFINLIRNNSTNDHSINIAEDSGSGTHALFLICYIIMAVTRTFWRDFASIWYVLQVGGTFDCRWAQLLTTGERNFLRQAGNLLRRILHAK
jgi:hypothetical protein